MKSKGNKDAALRVPLTVGFPLFCRTSKTDKSKNKEAAVQYAKEGSRKKSCTGAEIYEGRSVRSRWLACEC